MSYGSKQWQEWVLDEEESLPLIEHAYKQGINTWDTVNPILPRDMTERVVAKYTSNRRMSILMGGLRKLSARP